MTKLLSKAGSNIPLGTKRASQVTPTEEDFPGKARFLRKPYAPKHVLKALDELFSPNLGPYRYRHNVTQNYGSVA